MAGWPQIPIDIKRGYSFCFGCGKDNPIGLKLDFKQEGNTARAEFTPTELHQGWSGIVHGGIMTCLLDEAMGYATVFAGLNTVTASMKVRLKRMALIDEPLIITSSVTKNKRRLIETRATVSLKDGTTVAEGTATHFVINSAPEGLKSDGEDKGSNARKQS